LFDELRVCWNNILHDTTTFLLSDNADTFIWNIGKKGRFTVKSVYDALTSPSTGRYHKHIWKGKIPEKIKIFLWLLTNDAILTRDNLRKKKWQGDPNCIFCDSLETVSHMFFQCPIAKIIWVVVAKCFGASNVPTNLEQCWLWCEQWFPFGKKFHPWGIAAICWAIWKRRNKVVFEGKLLQNPLEIICHACALMVYWSGLFAEMDREQPVEGANTMLKVAKEVLAAQTTRQVNRLLLEDGNHADQDEDPA
jgi:hypothetical protein